MRVVLLAAGGVAEVEVRPSGVVEAFTTNGHGQAHELSTAGGPMVQVGVGYVEGEHVDPVVRVGAEGGRQRHGQMIVVVVVGGGAIGLIGHLS